MNEAYEKVRAFAAQIKGDEMDKDNTAILILTLDSKDFPVGESQTSALIKGTGEKLVELIVHTLLSDPKMKHLLAEALKFDMIKRFLRSENEEAKPADENDMPARCEPDSADVAAN